MQSSAFAWKDRKGTGIGKGCRSARFVYFRNIAGWLRGRVQGSRPRAWKRGGIDLESGFRKAIHPIPGRKANTDCVLWKSLASGGSANSG